MKRGARARGSQPRPGRLRVTVRAHYGALPFAAGRGGGRRRRKPSGSGVESLPRPHPEVRSLRLKTPQRMFAAAFAAARIRALRIAQARASLTRNVGGAPQGDALCGQPPSQAANRRATTTMLRLAALHSPHCLRGRCLNPTPHAARERCRTSFVGANGASSTRACCLKFESESR